MEFNAEFLAKKLAVMWQDNQDVGKMTGARTKVAGTGRLPAPNCHEIWSIPDYLDLPEG